MNERTTRRTDIQASADGLDCDLYRIVLYAERLYDRHKKHGDTARALHKALMALRDARSSLRSLMHEYDRERTNG